MDEMQSGASGAGTVPEDGMAAGPEDGVVAAPVHTPVAGTRRAAEDGERSVRRLSRGEFVAPPRDDSVPAPRPGGAGYRAAKRAFDIVFSLAVIAVLAVPVALLCLAIVLDSPGAPFFRQERVGLGGRRIYIWKLRSMVPDAHSNPGRYMMPEQLETWRREQKLDDDPRVTRVGRLLRRTSLDELPQFINVLTGDLSVCV